MATTLDLGDSPPPAVQPYRVLARKYRPQTFAELIGQDAMVRTLGNAIKRDRLAHAFLMTGVRGVGKTSTARLIAKALNCIGPDGTGGPTIAPCNVCDPCTAIGEGRFIDVVEIDAASNNGVDDVREMTEAVRYASVSARYKIYIIDEVHMMSKQAFNALLKTLEEPPPHVKFIMATTEVDKVPVTVLSRCQRFDLRRVPADVLADHFGRVSRAEQVDVEPGALLLIARAAEGSVRDGLSILDQAIAHADEATQGHEDTQAHEGAGNGNDARGPGGVTAQAVRAMLGLSDRAALRDLFDRLLMGDAPATIAMLRAQVDLGVEPAQVVRGLLEIVHATTIAKSGAATDPAQPAEERDAIEGWAAGLSFAALHRLWQLLLKGHEEVARSTDPNEAADMALLRVVHAGQMPDPSELARRLQEASLGPPAGSSPAARADVGAAQPTPVDAVTVATPVAPVDFAALVGAVEAAGRLQLAHWLREQTRLVRYAPPSLALQPRSPVDLRRLADELRTVTGVGWQVTAEDGEGATSLREQEQLSAEQARERILADPTVAAVFAHFPDAQLLEPSEQRKATA